ncbi:hypothetical protein [Mesonia aestuariivivens]|uniref:Uncharacterized protein n=1 Tax=Mesonia aestuariivivens TaxID=2796128 RepID=A0ABS6W131_9FLAO|nr:hypothetical protein [Mesonia aestuariivivens]MBW2961565.1 hypothetical protein [Mesonia aestuariivivens]
MRYDSKTDKPITWIPVSGNSVLSFPCGYVTVSSNVPCSCAGHAPGDPICTCSVKGYTQHDFIFDYLLPALADNLALLKYDLIPQNQQNYYDGVEINDPNNPNFSETYFNWNDFFTNISMAGLHDTQAFQDEIESDPVKYFIWNQYIIYAGTFD